MQDKKDEKKWTRKELSLRPGIYELAAAVIEQWRKDGSPESTRPDIWMKLLEELMED